MEQNEKTFLEPTDDMLEEVEAENEEKRHFRSYY